MSYLLRVYTCCGIESGVADSFEHFRAREGCRRALVGPVAAAARQVAREADGLDAQIRDGRFAREEVEGDLEGPFGMKLSNWGGGMGRAQGVRGAWGE